jgi:sirohydrochlorin cobaltochelatase
MTPLPTQAVVLFAHGSRDPLWHKPMEAVAQAMRQAAPNVQVVCAYLELSTPDLHSACAALLACGVRKIRVVPMFLGVGKHAREDLPVLMESLRAARPEVEFELQRAVGEEPRLVELLANIALGYIPG